MTRTTYLASPLTKFQLTHLVGMPVLLSFALWRKWHPRWLHTFGPMLLDSGAFSEFNSGKKVDIGAYKAHVDEWGWRFDAVAGLDDISGDYKRSLKNYEVLGFPTIHDTDPPELLDDLIPIARERGGWLGMGVAPVNGSRRHGKTWVDATLARIPRDIHVHGWALRLFRDRPRFDSVDSTNWFRDCGKLLADGIRLQWLTEEELDDQEHRANERQKFNRLGTDWPAEAKQARLKRMPMKWLSEGECLDLIVKRYQREKPPMSTTREELTTDLNKLLDKHLDKEIEAWQEQIENGKEDEWLRPLIEASPRVTELKAKLQEAMVLGHANANHCMQARDAAKTLATLCTGAPNMDEVQAALETVKGWQ